MITNAEIDRFYEYVGTLDLKFPVAAISKATGFSKGNVSDFLKKRKTPSENFLNKFYIKFPASPKKVLLDNPEGTLGEALIEVIQKKTGKSVSIVGEGPSEQTLLEIIKVISKDNSLLIHQHDKIVDTNAKIAETNRLISERFLVGQPTATEDRYTMIETVSMVRALKESLIDLESKMLKKSPQETRQSFHSKVKVERQKVESLGMRVEKGK